MNSNTMSELELDDDLVEIFLDSTTKFLIKNYRQLPREVQEGEINLEFTTLEDLASRDNHIIVINEETYSLLLQYFLILKMNGVIYVNGSFIDLSVEEVNGFDKLVIKLSPHSK